MKKLISIVLSTILACACFFGLVGGAATLIDVSKDKKYWEDVHEDSLESLSQLQDGINQLFANQAVYLSGLQTYKDGVAEYNASLEQYEEGSATFDEKKSAYEEGKQKIADGEATLKYSYEKLAAGQKEYDAGVAQLESAKAQLAAAQQELDANTAAYNEGKAKLAEAEPIYIAVMPLYQSYLSTVSDYEAASASGDLAETAQAFLVMTAAEAAMNAQLRGYSINGIISEYEAGQAQIAAYEAAAAQIADAEAQVAAAEARLAAAKQQLDAGYEEYDEGVNKVYTGKLTLEESESLIQEGEKKLADGAEQLEDGEKLLDEGASQLKVYEVGEQQLAAGLDQAIATETWFNSKGEALLPTVAERLGDDFIYWEMDGDRVVRKNGQDFIDLYKAQQVVDTTEDFVNETVDTVTQELTGRVICTILLLIASVGGIVAAVFGMAGKSKLGFGLALGTVIISLASVILGAALGECTMSKLAGGYFFNLAIAEIILLCSSALFLISQLLSSVKIEISKTA